MPQLGMGMFEGSIVRWIASDGAAVKHGDELLEIQTEKVIHTIEASADGVLQRIVDEGTTIPVRGVIGYLLAPNEPRVGVDEAVRPASKVPLMAEVPSREGPDRQPREARASPIARRLAAEHDVDLTTIIGSGPNGRIVEKDVLDAVAAREAITNQVKEASPGASAQGEMVEVLGQDQGETIPISGIRQIIFDRMGRSARTVARVTEFVEVDATPLVELRQRLNAHLKSGNDLTLSYNDLLIKIVATALRKHRQLNSTLIDNQIRMLESINVGLAVDTEHGLVVPVVHDADCKSFGQIARDLRALIERIRNGKSLPEDFIGGTFTITNLGMFGIDGFTPIVNLPECAILGVGRIAARPAVHNGEIAIRQLMILSLSFDHRLIDGAPAARFLQQVKQMIEMPSLLLA